MKLNTLKNSVRERFPFYLMWWHCWLEWSNQIFFQWKDEQWNTSYVAISTPEHRPRCHWHNGGQGSVSAWGCPVARGQPSASSTVTGLPTLSASSAWTPESTMSWDMAQPASPPCLGLHACQLQKTAFWEIQGQFFLQQPEGGCNFMPSLGSRFISAQSRFCSYWLGRHKLHLPWIPWSKKQRKVKIRSTSWRDLVFVPYAIYILLAFTTHFWWITTTPNRNGHGDEEVSTFLPAFPFSNLSSQTIHIGIHK